MNNTSPQQYKIFILFDPSEELNRLEGILESLNYQTKISNNPESAINEIKIWEPHLVIINETIGESCGYSLCKTFTQEFSERHLRVIMILNKCESNDILKAYESGACDYLIPPFHVAILKAKLKSSFSFLIAQEMIEKENNRLQETLDSRNTLLSAIAHDLRSSLGSVHMALNLLSSELNDQLIGEDLYKLTTESFDVLEQTLGMFENLLVWTKNVTGKYKATPCSVRVSELIDYCIHGHMSMAKNKNIFITSSCNEDDLVAWCDATMIKCALNNLINNAIKFSNPNSTIKISCRHNNDHLIITVSDQGVGMSPEQVDMISQQISFTTFGTLSEKGSGLGIQITRDFITANKGTLWVNSEKNKGTHFHFSLPLEPCTEAPEVNLDKRFA